MKQVTLYLHGLRSQTQSAELIRVWRGMVVVKGYVTPKAYYRLTDGRRCNGRGVPLNWDFWRVSEADCRALQTQGE